MRSDAYASRPSSVPTPKWLNPWVIAFFVGITIITVMRPRTRYIPDPPAVAATLPAALVMNPKSPATPGIRIYGFVGPGDAAKATMASLSMLGSKFAAHELPVTAIAWVLPGATAEIPSPVIRLELPSADAIVALLQPVATGKTPPATEPWKYGLLLVDSQNGFRGFYKTDESGEDELFHRADRVVRLERGE